MESESRGSRDAGSSPAGKVLSINVGRSSPLDVGNGMTVESGIVKRTASNEGHPVDIEVRRLGLVGDEQVDPSVHGGLSKAVYLYPIEHYSWWEAKRVDASVDREATPLPFGALGENLTTRGVLESDLWVGDRLIVGEVELQVESPRNPCFKFNAAMGYRKAVKHMLLTGRAGVYLSVVTPGCIRGGMAIDIVPGPREVSIIGILAWRRSRAVREP